MKPGRSKSEEGLAALELLVMIPFVLLVIGALATLELLVAARADVEGAAAEAARAASLQRSSDAAHDAGLDAAQAALADRGRACAELSVHVDVTSYQPGGRVTATVACTPDTSGVNPVGVVGVTLDATSAAPIEQYREAGL